MQGMDDWDSLRIFLAMHRAGSLAGAAARLWVDATTVGRRLERLERDLGGKLFLRTRAGLQLTPRGAALLGPAEEAERVMQTAERRALGEDQELAGRIALTAADVVIQGVLPALEQFRELHPGIELELISTGRALNLAKREADLALRAGRVLDPDLVARRVGRATIGLYASRKYLQRRGRPPADLAGHDVVTFSGELEPASAALGLPALFRHARPAVRANNTGTVLQAVLAGLGIGPVSAMSARDFPELELVRPEPVARRETFLVGYREVIKSGRVKALWEHLLRYFAGAPIL